MIHLNKPRWGGAGTLLAAGLLIVSILSILASPLSAAAAPPAAAKEPAKDSAKAQADVRYDQGKAYYRTGAYDLAIQEFLAGYELDPRPGVLFNVARGYEELKNRPKAIEFYRRYLNLGPAATAAAEARARMVALERQIKEDDERQKAEAIAREQQRQRDEAAAAAVAATSTSTTRASLDATNGGVGAAQGEVATTPAPPGSPTLARNLRIGGVVAGAMGVAATALGVVFVIRGNNLNSEIRSEIDMSKAWTTDLASKDSDRKTDNKVALISCIAGGAAIAGGAVLYYLGWRESTRVRPGSVALAPAYVPGGSFGSASLAMVGTF